MVIALLAVGPAAEATFPGRNGEIAYLDLLGVFSDSPTERTLMQVCASGSHERPLLPRTLDGSDAVFSPNGRMAASGGIFLAPITGRRSRLVSRPPRRAEDLDPVWSPHGGALAFTRVRRARDFQVLSTAVRVYRRGRGRFLARGFAPAWSVRGQIAFVRGPYNEPGTIHVASVRSGATRRLTTGYQPAWSPNGRRLVFTYDLSVPPEDAPATGIATISADGRRLRRLTNGSNPSWSPDGRWIAFQDPAGYVAVISPSGRGLRRLARSPGPPLFSPDSRWIAYPSRFNEELYVVPVKGGSRRWVTSSSEELDLLDWRAAPASETRC